jgi:hypothetical protein
MLKPRRSTVKKKIVAIVLSVAVFAALTPLNAQWVNVVSEDFNSTWSTTSPPAGWTIHYDGSVGNSDWHPYYGWSYTGSDCAYIYYNPSETGTDELISPTFDCSSADQVYLAASHHFSHYTTPYSAQWVGSVDGGATFPYVIYDYNYISTGPQRDSFPFPEAIGQSNVCIAFRLDGYTWNINYWYVDDVDVWVHQGGGPGVFLSENFEGGSFPPPGWTTDNESGDNQWFRNDVWGRTNYAGGDGYCADNDDDAAGAGAPLCQYNTLTSPSFSCATAPIVTLEYTMSYSHGADAEARVEVMNSDGSWIVVNYRDDVDPTGPGQVETYNISKYAAGEDDVRIRFVYHEFSPGQNGWFEVDNVEVRRCVGVDTLINENFNSAWGPDATNPPAGWTINYDGSVGPSDWFNGNWGGGTTTGGGVADMYYSPSETGVDEFISPTIDCSAGYGEVWLAFEHEYDNYSTPYTAQILGSTNGGSSWPEIIWDYNNADYARARDSIDISGWALGEDDVAFNWYGNGYTWNINQRGFDNVLVVGFADCGLPPPYVYLDLELVQIIRPQKKEEGGVAVGPSIKIFNNVDSVAHATATCKIRDISTMTVVYEDNLGNVPLDPGYNVISGFKDFTPEGDKTYNVQFVVNHPDDINTENNIKEQTTTTEAGINVTPFEIALPTDPQEGPFVPTANFREEIGAEGIETAVTLYCQIVDASLLEVYNNSMDHTFSANEEFPAEFSRVDDLVNGSYTITFWAEDRGDTVSFPPLSKDFVFGGVAEEPLIEHTDLKVYGNTVNFTLASPASVSIRVYDATGKLVSVLVEDSREAGFYTIPLNTKDFSSGVYFIQMVTPDFKENGKFTVVK